MNGSCPLLDGSPFPPTLGHWWSEPAQRSSLLWSRSKAKFPAISGSSKIKPPAQVGPDTTRPKRWLKLTWGSSCPNYNKLCFLHPLFTWVLMSKHLWCALGEKLYNLNCQSTCQTNDTGHREWRPLEKNQHYPLQDCCWFPDSPLSSFLRSVLLLCLIKLLLLKTALCLPTEFFASRKNGRNHCSANDTVIAYVLGVSFPLRKEAHLDHTLHAEGMNKCLSH